MAANTTDSSAEVSADTEDGEDLNTLPNTSDDANDEASDETT